MKKIATLIFRKINRNTYWKIIKNGILAIFFWTFLCFNIFSITGNRTFAASWEVIQTRRFDTSLNQSIDKVQHLKNDIEIQTKEWWGATIRNFIFNKTISIVIPIVIIIGIIFSIIGFYRVIFSKDAETTKIWFQYIAYWVIGILIMMSAKYITEVLTNDMLKVWGNDFTFSPGDLASQLYTKIAFPFIKILIYLVLGGLFIVLAMQLIKYIFSTDDKAKKGAGTIISWNIIGMLIIIGSKQIIEAIYWSQEKILNQNAQSLQDVGDAVLATKELPLLYTIINWVMGLTSLIVLIIIIWQSFQLLTQPSDSNQFSKIKKSLLYIFAGILVIGAGYLITNFLIIN